MRISNKEVTLLGLLNEKPMHGYEIEQEITQRDMRYWTEISISMIYKLLKKLEEKGLVKVKINLTDNNVAQKINIITIKGKKALKERVQEIISEPEHMRWQMDLGINNLNVLNKKEITDGLTSYIKKLEKLVSGYQELEKYLAKEKCPAFRLALSHRPQYLFEAEIEWVKNYIERLNFKNK